MYFTFHNIYYATFIWVFLMRRFLKKTILLGSGDFANLKFVNFFYFCREIKMEKIQFLLALDI